jgi:hypothetical protein
MSTIQVGDELTPLVLEMTATRIVAGAIATRDFMPVHHDRDYANSQGAPDIFMNILSSTAYCSRFVTDWAGPDTMIKKIAIRLGVPVHPKSTLDIIDVEFRAANDLGDHLTGTATISLPAGAS